MFHNLSDEKKRDTLEHYDVAEVIKVLGPRKSVAYSFIACEEHLRLLAHPFDPYWREAGRIKQLAKFATYYDSKELYKMIIMLNAEINWTKYFVCFVGEKDDLYACALQVFSSFPMSQKTLEKLFIYKVYTNMLPYAFSLVTTDFFMKIDEHNMTEEVVSAMIVAGHKPDTKLLWRLLISKYSSRRAIQLLAKHIDTEELDRPLVKWRDSFSDCYKFPCTVRELAALRGMKHLLSRETRKQYLREIDSRYREELQTYFKKGGFASDGLVEAVWPLDNNFAASMGSGLKKSEFRLQKEKYFDLPPQWWPNEKVHSSTWNYRYSNLAGSNWHMSSLNIYWSYI